MIRLQSVSYVYGKKRVLENVNMEIRPGSVCGLLGKNGAGKTTLLGILGGLLFAERGKTEVLGYDPAKRNPEMLSDLFFQPEEFVLPALKGTEWLAIRRGFYPKWSESAFRDGMALLEVDPTQRLDRMSAGTRKKFLVGFGLATNARLVIMDEPTNGLDIPSKSQFRKLVAAAASDERALIISTHQVRDLESLIDPVVIIEAGCTVLQTPISLVSERLSTVFLADIRGRADVLASDVAPGGFRALVSGGGGGGEIDLELLFNAAVQNPEKLSAALGRGGAL
jgi:ABC-2 type transport system ATP-binding protein